MSSSPDTEICQDRLMHPQVGTQPNEVTHDCQRLFSLSLIGGSDCAYVSVSLGEQDGSVAKKEA